jgi:hypothetical protein
MIAVVEVVKVWNQREEPEIGQPIRFSLGGWSNYTGAGYLKRGVYLGDNNVMVFYTQNPLGFPKSYYHAWLGNAHLVLPSYE